MSETGLVTTLDGKAAAPPAPEQEYHANPKQPTSTLKITGELLDANRKVRRLSIAKIGSLNAGKNATASPWKRHAESRFRVGRGK